jgi:hypothetical protein
LASARAITASNSFGAPGTSTDTGFGGSCRCAYIFATSDSRGYGTWPVSASNNTQPSEYTSTRASSAPPEICSGAT